MTSLTLFQKTFIFRRPSLANFADIIKIAIMFIKTTFKDSKKGKRIRNYSLKCSLYLYFWYNKNFRFLVKDTDVSRTLEVCHIMQLLDLF